MAGGGGGRDHEYDKFKEVEKVSGMIYGKW